MKLEDGPPKLWALEDGLLPCSDPEAQAKIVQGHIGTNDSKVSWVWGGPGENCFC
jgi:hypothetical protein